MTSPRIEKIRKTRSVVDLMAIVEEIQKESTNNSKIVSNLIESLSADEIYFDERRPEKSVTRVKIKVPAKGVLEKHLSVLNKLHANIEELDAAEALLKTGFAGNRKATEAFKAVKELRQDIDNKLNDAFDALNSLAEKHLPTEIQDFSDKLERYLIKNIPHQSYGDMHKEFYVAPGKAKDEIDFSCYISLDDLKDSKGYVHRDFYFVLTGVIDKTGNMRLHLNTFPEYKLPGSYPLGKEVANENAMKMRASMLLAHNNFELEHKKLTFPVSETKAKNLGLDSIKGVNQVFIHDDEMVLIIDPTVKDNKVTDLAGSIIARLRGVIGQQSVHFKYTLGKAKGKRALKFILTPNEERGQVNKDLRINSAKLSELTHALDLKPAQVEALKHALQS